MSDILLSVGLQKGSAETSQIQTDLQSIISQVNKNPPKVLVGLRVDQSAINHFKSQLSAIINGVGLSNGAPITINISGLGEISSKAKETRHSLDSMKSSAEQASDAVGRMSVGKAQTALTQINTQLGAIRSNYEKWTAAATGQSSTAYAEYGNQIQALETLKAQVISNTISFDDFRIRLGAIKLAASEAALAIRTVGEDRSITVLATNTEEYRTAMAKCNRELVALRRNQEQWTAAKNGVGAADYAALGQYERQIEELIIDLNKGTLTLEQFNSRFSLIKSGADSSRTSIHSLGLATKSLGDRIKGLANKFSAWLSVSQVIMQVIRAIRKMVNDVRSIDKAMTELKKVTSETNATYNKFLEDAAVRAKKVGASISDVVSASADFARLGYGLKDAAVLADAALIYKNIGDGIEDISEATESIVSTMQAFGIEASNVMTIVDKFNKVGNNYAISSAGIGEAMKRSSAAMAAANNTIEETIALITAANTIVQNPESVGTTMKTVSMYLRAAKTEAEEAGESTDGMAGSISELRNEILSLTGNRVDIQIDDDTFKSTYQILKELSEVWDHLSDVSRANILEMVGGKRNANVVSALLENFSVAENAMKTASSAAGSAIEENEKHLQSIEGTISKFQATFQSFSQNLIGSTTVKVIVQIGTALVSVLNALQKIHLLLPGITAVAVAIKSIGLAKTLNATTQSLIINKGATEGVALAISKLTMRQKKRVVSDIESAVASGALSASEAKQILTTLGLTTAEGGLTVANKGLAASFKSVTASIPVWGLIALGISAVIELSGAFGGLFGSSNDAKKSISELNEELEQTKNEIQNISNEYKELKKSADDVIPRFSELAKGVNRFGENVGLTDEEYEEFLSLNNQIAEMFPEINLGMDTAGNAMLSLSYSADTLANSLWDLVKAEREMSYQAIAERMPGTLETVSGLQNDYNTEIEKLEEEKQRLGELYNRIISRDLPTDVGWWSHQLNASTEAARLVPLMTELEELFGLNSKASMVTRGGLLGTDLFKEYNYDIEWDYDSLNYSKVLELYNAKINGLDQQIRNYEKMIASKWKEINPIVGAWLNTDYLFNDLGPQMQKIASIMVSGIDFSELGLTTEKEIQKHISDYILQPLYLAAPEVKDALENAISQLQSGDITYNEFEKIMKEAFDALVGNMDAGVVDVFKQIFISGYDSAGEFGTSFETVCEGVIESWGGVVSALSGQQISFRGILSEVHNLKSGFDMLGVIYADVRDKGEFNWSSILSDDKFVSAFGSLGSVYDDFIETIAKSPTDISACQKAFDNLATAYINNSDALKNVTDDTRDATIAMLEQDGIANAKAIVDARLAYNEKLLRVQTELGTAAKYKDIYAMYQACDAASLEEQIFAQLAIAKMEANNTQINTSNDIDNLIALANSANATKASLENLAKAKELIHTAKQAEANAEKAYLPAEKAMHEKVAQELYKQAQALIDKKIEFEVIDASKFKVNYAGGSQTNSSKGGSSGKNKSWFDEQLAEHKHLVAMEQETTAEYIAWLSDAYPRAYEEGILTLDDFFKYQEEVFEGLKDLFRDNLSDIEHEISMRQNYDGEAKKIIELYEKLIKDVEEEIAKARARGLTDEDDYIQELQGKWQDYTNSISDMREDFEDAAKDAIDSLVDYRVDMLKREIEDEKDALDKKLDNLKEFYDKQKEMLQDQRDEEKYLDEQEEKRKTVSDLQAELAMLEFDDSSWAQKRKLEIKEELSTAQEELDEFEKDHALDMALDVLDNAYNDQESQIKAEMDALEERLNDPEALFNKALEDIRKNSENQLYYQMLMYNRQFGDGNDETVIELWESAYGALTEYEKLFGELYKGVKLGNETGVKDEGGWDSESISGTNPENQRPSTPPTDDNTSEEETAAPQLTDDIKKKVAAAIWNGGYGWGTGSTRTKRLTEVFGAGNGIQSLVDKGVGRSGISVTNEYTYANMRKKFRGYASGTKSATPGWHELFEGGLDEYIFTSSDGSKYRMFSGLGDKVLNGDATDFLYDFANSGGTVLTNMLASLLKASGLGNIAKPVQAIEIHSGDVIVHGNATERTVSEIRRAQRDNLEFVLKEFNRLNK